MNRADSGRASERRGHRAEALAAWALRLKGYRVVAYRVPGPRGSGVGEIDLVVRRGNVLAFVEVKARPSHEAGLWAILPQQQRRLMRAAEWFIKSHPGYGSFDMRFDAVVVRPRRWPTHLPDAWRPESRF